MLNSTSTNLWADSSRDFKPKTLYKHPQIDSFQNSGCSNLKKKIKFSKIFLKTFDEMMKLMLMIYPIK